MMESLNFLIDEGYKFQKLDEHLYEYQKETQFGYQVLIEIDTLSDTFKIYKSNRIDTLKFEESVACRGLLSYLTSKYRYLTPLINSKSAEENRFVSCDRDTLLRLFDEIDSHRDMLPVDLILTSDQLKSTLLFADELK